MAYPRLIDNLIEQLTKLPGVGRRSAERMAFWFLNSPHDDIKTFTESILKVKECLRFCRLCNNLGEEETCAICKDPGRDTTKICVVEDPKDLLAVEKTGIYKGLYYVLLGAIAPTEGRGPDDLQLGRLAERIKENKVTELIIATDADTEGEMTAIYIQKTFKALGIKITRIGLGLPMGSSLEYADLSTLTMSMSARREL